MSLFLYCIEFVMLIVKYFSSFVPFKSVTVCCFQINRFFYFWDRTPIQVYYFFHLPSMWHNNKMFGLVQLCRNLVFMCKVWWNGDFKNKMDYLFRRNTLISFCRGIVSINSVVQGLLVESSVHNINLTHTNYLKFYIHSGKCKYERLMESISQAFCFGLYSCFF